VVSEKKRFETFFSYGYISYIKENVVKNKFWKDVFHAWNTFIDKEENFTWEYFLFSPLWMNKAIKIEKVIVLLVHLDLNYRHHLASVVRRL
jgi:hypothetical protein